MPFSPLQQKLKQLHHKYTLWRQKATPTIHEFSFDDIYLVERGAITLNWKVSNAHKVIIKPYIGEVTGYQSVCAKLMPNVDSFELIAYGGTNKSSQKLTIPITHTSPHTLWPNPNIQLTYPNLEKLPRLGNIYGFREFDFQQTNAPSPNNIQQKLELGQAIVNHTNEFTPELFNQLNAIWTIDSLEELNSLKESLQQVNTSS